MRRLTTEEREFLTEKGRCPFCGSDRFSEGPSGGLSQNVYCNSPELGRGAPPCDARFNLMGPLGVELIQDPTTPSYEWAVNKEEPTPKPPPKFSKEQILAKFGVGKRHWWQRD